VKLGGSEQVDLSRKSCTLYSKKRNVFSRFEELRRNLCAELPRVKVILDGEIVAIDDEGRVDFYGLMRGQGPVHFAAFERQTATLIGWPSGISCATTSGPERDRTPGHADFPLLAPRHTTSAGRADIIAAPRTRQPVVSCPRQ
jgi:hypothetical protein